MAAVEQRKSGTIMEDLEQQQQQQQQTVCVMENLEASKWSRRGRG